MPKSVCEQKPGCKWPQTYCQNVRAGDSVRVETSHPGDMWAKNRRMDLRLGPVTLERITVDPARMQGLACIRDLRVTVAMVLGQLAAGRTFDQVLEDYPYLEREDILAALEYASAVVNEREVPVTRPA